MTTSKRELTADERLLIAVRSLLELFSKRCLACGAFGHIETFNAYGPICPVRNNDAYRSGEKL